MGEKNTKFLCAELSGYQLKVGHHDYKIFYISLMITTHTHTQICGKFTEDEKKGIKLYHRKAKAKNHQFKEDKRGTKEQRNCNTVRKQ